MGNKSIASANLKILRKELRLSQKELAGKLNISQPYFGNMETGNREISMGVVATLHELYAVSADWLLFGKGTMFGSKDDEGDLVPA